MIYREQTNMNNVLVGSNERMQQCPIYDRMDAYNILAYVKIL